MNGIVDFAKTCIETAPPAGFAEHGTKKVNEKKVSHP
jgi:hypothetical protein